MTADPWTLEAESVEIMLLRRLGFTLAFFTLGCLSCAGASPHVTALDFFKSAPADDPWNRKVAEWQERHREDAAHRGSAPEFDSDLAHAYADFGRELKLRIAKETVRFTQEQSREVYEPDGDTDHWATLTEVLRGGGDDCDGLDLITFQLLRNFGFERDEIVRSIVVHRPSGQHHMVTLWFENGRRDTDPWVLDPTGIVADGLSRLSDIGEWDPIEAFDEEAHYRVEDHRPPAAVSEQ